MICDKMIITTKKEYTAAVKRIEILIELEEGTLTPEQTAELNMLADAVMEFEEKYYNK